MRAECLSAVLLSCAFAAMLAACSASADAATEPASIASCPGAAQSSDFDSLQRALARDERAVDLRLKLAEALLPLGCYAQAVQVLEQGEALHPRSSAIQTRLRYARSMLSEQRYIEGLAGAEHAAKTQRNILRCRKLGDVAACDELLREKPDRIEIMVAKADALLAADQPAAALLLYRRALELDPKATGLGGRLSAAESRRQQWLSKCQADSGQPALEACQLVLIRGADDEFSIHQRKGLLLQAMDEPSKALDAYIAANLLQPGDSAVAHAIVALTDSIGRSDALTLAARGNALLTLQRGAEALAAFRQAQTLFPGLQNIEASLAAAETLAANEARQRAEEQANRNAALSALREEHVKVARLALEEKLIFSNAAPPSRSH